MSPKARSSSIKSTSSLSLVALLLGVFTLFFFSPIGLSWLSLDEHIPSLRKPWSDNEESLVQSCADHNYKTHIYSTSPLVIYIEDFVRPAERQQLMHKNLDALEPAKTYRGLYNASIDKTVRDASMTILDPAEDGMTNCMIDRAMSIHGRRKSDTFESAVMQRYGPGGHFRNHKDCFKDSTVAQTGGNRVSTFLVYLEADCTGGGTNFPRLPRPDDESWCEFVECGGEDQLEGTTFKPVAGNAVYWQSLHEDGRANEETLHSGTPVKQGTKTIVNIWMWRQLFDKDDN